MIIQWLPLNGYYYYSVHDRLILLDIQKGFSRVTQQLHFNIISAENS